MYPSSYSVSLTRSRELQVPSFTACLPHNTSREFTVSEIYTQLAPNLRINCQIVIFAHESGQLVNQSCSAVGEYEYYIFRAHYCMNYGVHGLLWTKRSLAARDRVYTISFPKEKGTAYFVTHQNGDHVSSSLNYQALRATLISYLFRVVSVRRLPAPYPGNCFNYTSYGMVSADHCLDLCMAKLSIREHNEWPQDVAARSDVNLTISAMDSNAYVVKCENECGADECYHQQYTAVAGFGDKQNGVNFMVSASPEFDLESTEVAKFQFIELICYVASLASLWYGSSVLMVGRTVLKRTSEQSDCQSRLWKR
ncbi:hypothetical protein HDE_05705 [Halotydeus destructor]|nr:hypothetical protein HDE_05705 [Halotydeus destructor]